MLSFTSSNNSIAVTQQLLKLLEVLFTNQKTEEALLQKTDYPSIAAVQGCSCTTGTKICCCEV